MAEASWRLLPLADGPPGANAMTVDVEDYFHAAALAPAFPRERWGALPSRVEAATQRTLALFDRFGAKGTFFILGSVARAHPALVRAIAAAGHEIASHGDTHRRVREQTPQAFAADVHAAKSSIEDAAGTAVRGYRAANFSIDRATWWAFDVLAGEGYAYSSSVNPIRHDHYGVPDAPRTPFLPLAGADFVEIPITTVMLGGQRLPAGGGGYFRLLPYGLSRGAIDRVRARDGQPANFYFHPWEIDPGQPRAAVGLKSRFRHYVNLATMEAKLAALLGAFRWSRMDMVYGDALAPALGRPLRGAA